MKRLEVIKHIRSTMRLLKLQTAESIYSANPAVWNRWYDNGGDEHNIPNREDMDKTADEYAMKSVVASSIMERAHQYGVKAAGGHYEGGMRGAVYEGHRSAYVEVATEQFNIDKEIIQKLVDVLQTSKNYHLGITALDSEAEILHKQRTRETALIRSINEVLEDAMVILNN